MAKVISLPVAARGSAELSDEALLAACSTADRAALGALFDRHADAMTRFVRRLGHVDDQDVDDIVHDTFIEVIRVAGSFRGGSTVPLGTGAADIPKVLRLLKDAGYRGDFVLQAARGADDLAAARHYKEQLASWLSEAGF